MTARTPPSGTEPTPDSAKSGRTKHRKEEMRRQHDEWLDLTGKEVLDNITRLRAKARQAEKENEK